MVSASNNNKMAKAKGINISKRKGMQVANLGALRGGEGSGRVVMAPVAQNKSAGQTGGKSLRFKEVERVATVNGSIAFGVTGSLACNPGLAGSFPWLSGHAALFERYRIHKLVYRYKNLKGTATNGNILMSFDYDTLDNSPATAIEMTQSTVYADGAPWRIFELAVPTDKRDLFTRAGTVAGADLKTYDMGKLHVAAEGCADTTPHGYLEVEYDVELFMKQSVTSGTASSSGGSAEISTTGALSQNTAGLTGAGLVISAPAGKYQVTISQSGSMPTSTSVSFAGVSITNIGSGSAIFNPSNTGLVTLTVPGVLGTVALSGAASALTRIIVLSVD